MQRHDRARQYDFLVSRSHRARRLPSVLGATAAYVLLGIGSSVIGAAVVAVLLVLRGLPTSAGGQPWTLGISAAGYVGLSLVTGSAWTGFLQRRTVRWVAAGRPPTYGEAKRTLRLPGDLARVSGTLWLLGTVLLGVLGGLLGTAWDGIVVALTIGLGGLTTTSITYLLAERLARPVMAMALEVAPPRGRLSVTVLVRLVLTWMLASGVPLLGVLLVVVLPHEARSDRIPSLVLLVCSGLLVGALATAVLARSVAFPLRGMRAVLGKVAQGDTSVGMRVDDSSEIGMLQVALNDLVAGLREQDRLRDMFGRHVGTDVARQALEVGVSLTGEVREVTALFVDVVDSTVLAHQRPPDEVAAKLNRLFSIVVEAVGANGGLVNKFQGDAALCIFGAPTRLPAAATAALRTAREIRDATRALGELDLGIGLAGGPVFAGHLGADARLEYTVIGDAVNEAARLTDSAKQVPGRILASQAVIERCRDEAGDGGDGAIDRAGHDGTAGDGVGHAMECERWSAHGTLRLRGREEPTEAWVDERHPPQRSLPVDQQAERVPGPP